jgi:hypothetical protein
MLCNPCEKEDIKCHVLEIPLFLPKAPAKLREQWTQARLSRTGMSEQELSEGHWKLSKLELPRREPTFLQA